MEHKKKACKGMNKAKGFDGCGEIKIIHRYGLCSSCFANWLYNTDEGKKVLNKSVIRGKTIVQKEKKAQYRKEKDSIRNWNAELQSVINHIARLIDNGLPCLAKGRHPNQMHGGHIISRDANKIIRFNLHNIHRQSAQSNHFKNEDGLLREKLALEYGEKYFDFVMGLQSTPVIKLSNKQMQELHTKALKIRLSLVKLNNKYSLDERIALRNKYNLELGIYSEKYCVFK